MRLNRFLAAAGLGSRRSCEELIRTGQVSINGVLCESLATTVEPSDVVKLGNRVLRTAAPVTLLLNKPPGFLCTAADTHERQTVFDLLPPNFTRLFHVGRLDRDSEGLLILTNDGSLALKLTHPRYKVDKEYEVVLDHFFDFELASKLLHGMNLEDGWAKAESVFKLGNNKLKVVLRQGMKRQIRLMFFALGYEVKRLVRTRIGPVEIQNMPSGSWRVLTQKEIDSLLAEGAKAAAAASAERRVAKSRPAVSLASKGDRPVRAFKPTAKAGAPHDKFRDSARFEKPRRNFSSRPAHGPTEEIPFVPRANRERGEHAAGEKPGERPHSTGFKGGKSAAKPARKSFGKKPFAAQGGKPAQKSGPRPFAKFERRRARD